MGVRGRLDRLERSTTGRGIGEPWAVCGVCGGYHVRTLAQVVAAGEGRRCGCARCGCAAAEAEYARIVEGYA